MSWLKTWMNFMIRFAYSLATYLFFFGLYSFFGKGKYPDKTIWRQHFGNYPRLSSAPIWMHCASLGEANVAAPLYKHIKKNHPDRNFLISLVNVQDYLAVKDLYPRETVVMFPFDCPHIVRRALTHIKPSQVIFIDSEIWPNFLHICAKRDIPVHIINGRISKGSFRRFQWLPKFFRQNLFKAYHSILVSDSVYVDRFIQLGARPEIVKLGNHLRWNYEPPEHLLVSGQELRAEIARPVWLAASVHPDEMTAVLAIHQYLRLNLRDILLVLAPRYPQKDKATLQSALQSRGIGYLTLNHADDPHAEIKRWQRQHVSVVWINRVGDLMRWYSMADVALIGGSFNKMGGHNPIEAALGDCGIFSGADIDNFTSIYQSFSQHDACVIHSDFNVLGQLMLKTITGADAREILCANARQCVQAHRQEIEKFLVEILPQPN